MNEKLQYATMLEIPVNTCNVTYKPVKKRNRKRKKVDEERVKEQLLNKINSEMQDETVETNGDEQIKPLENQNIENLQSVPESQDTEQDFSESTVRVHSVGKRKFKFKLSIIGVQLAIIGVLIAAIFLTNAIYTDSGINVFLREIFGTQTSTQADLREYGDFAPVISLDDGASVSLSNGVMTFTGKGSVYAPCDGKVTMLIGNEDGTYTIEITHSENFKSLLSGIDYAYADLDEQVYYNIPVGYVKSGATMCFTGSDGSVISDYQIVDDAVVWAV